MEGFGERGLVGGGVVCTDTLCGDDGRGTKKKGHRCGRGGGAGRGDVMCAGTRAALV